ncbi:MAG: polysaccharide deacetylase family protein [Candidatus Cyclobacteriaceae bacterium M3_2C_046]
MNTQLKSYLSKINFALGRNPRIEKVDHFWDYIPDGYQAVITISADFELAWAWRYGKNQHPDAISAALQKARREREHVPKILDLCDAFDIPITWATVGHLFLSECDGRHSGLAQPRHFENNYWKFDQGDWYQHDPGSNLEEAPEWYCPDLIKRIQEARVEHEIGCHTFSHIDCRDEVCSADLFRAELKACQQVAKKYGIDLKTFIYPAHTVGNLEQLKKMGFSNYRSNEYNTLGYPQKHPDGLWEIKTSLELRLRRSWSLKYHVARVTKVIQRAIMNNSVCHFWFHPSFAPEYLDQVLPEIFDFLDFNRDRIWITTMEKYVNWLNHKHALDSV